MRDKNVVGDFVSANPGEEGVAVKLVDVEGVVGDNNRTKDSREGEAKPSTAAVRAREFDQAATKPPLEGFVTFSDAVDSYKEHTLIKQCLVMKNSSKQTYAGNRISIRLFFHWELTICFEIETKF